MKLFFIIIFLPFYLCSYPIYEAKIDSLQDADWYLTGGGVIIHLSKSLGDYLSAEIQEKMLEGMKYYGSVLIIFDKKEKKEQLSLLRLLTRKFHFRNVGSITHSENKKFHTITKTYSYNLMKDIMQLFPREEYPSCVTFVSENKDELKEFEQKIKRELQKLWYCNLVHISQKS